MKKKLIILSSVVLLSISISAGYVMKPIGDNTGCVVAIEQEKGLEVEDWMVNSDVWSFDYDLSNDPKLEIEDWMVDESVWN